MSLINDALKRAQEAQRPNTPSSVASLRSIETRPKDRPFISWVLVVVIFLLLAATFAFIGLAMTGRMATKNVVARQTITAPPVQSVVAPVQPVPPTPAVLNVTPIVPVVPIAAMAIPVEPIPAPVVTSPALPALVLPGTLHVQGIAYDPVRPWAIVSGRTVYVGDLVKGVRVMEISRNFVIFGSHGQTNLLFIGE